MRLLLSLLLAACVAGPAQALTFDWVTIADPGNDPDPETGFGAVPGTYAIGRTEVTNAQYAEFLNAVASHPLDPEAPPEDPNGNPDPVGLWDRRMAGGVGGITRTQQSDGSFLYEPRPGRAQRPVVYVSFFDAARFVNWLERGQPEVDGPPQLDVMGDGTYTVTVCNAVCATNLGPERNPASTFFLPSEDEWYKAAFYDPDLDDYFDYPTGSNSAPACGAPASDSGNQANCAFAAGQDLADIGAYSVTQSPYGVLDLAGNVAEWNEALVDPRGYFNGAGKLSARYLRGLRGAAWNSSSAVSAKASSGGLGVVAEDDDISMPGGLVLTEGGPGFGFRVAMLPIPEPATGGLVSLGLAGLALLRRRGLPDLRAR